MEKSLINILSERSQCTDIGITFLEAIKLIQSAPNEKRIGIGAEFFDHLAHNKEAFDNKLVEEEIADFETVAVKGNDAKMIKLLKALSKCKKLTDTQDEILQKMLKLWQNGEIPANITKEALKLAKSEQDELQLFAVIYDLVPDRYFGGRTQNKTMTDGEKHVILSCWIKNGGE